MPRKTPNHRARVEINRDAPTLSRAPGAGTAADVPVTAAGHGAPVLSEIAGYSIVRELGKGGMGVVYEAVRKSNGQRVAIKIIVPAAPAGDRDMQLFAREASVLSQLDHPRIVKFLEMGFAAGQLYLSMEYVDRIDLGAILGGQPLAARTRLACAIICQVLEALAYAHERSFVHRDVKPSNILATRDGKKIRTKLADFGLAKNYQHAGFSGMTADGEIRGTAAFMPPEQIVDSRFAEPPADIYSAGATLYFFLAGRLPYDFTQGRSSLAIVLEQSPIDLGSVLPDLPSGLTALVHRALAREPSDRFASAAAMRRALLPFAVS